MAMSLPGQSGSTEPASEARGEADGDAGRLHRHLDAIGVPWRDNYASLAERFGIVPDGDTGRASVIRITTARPFMRGMLYPLQVRAGSHIEPDVPVETFETRVSFALGAEGNLRQAVLLLQPILGNGETQEYGGHIWRYGRSYVEIERGDDRGQPEPDREPTRDPRLQAACLLTIHSVSRRPLNPADLEALSSFIPILQFDQGLQHTLIYKPSLMDQWDYLREPAPEHACLYRWLGWSGDRSTLIVFNNELFLIPVDDVMGVEVTRILPARGGGGSTMYLICRSMRSDRNRRWIEVANASRADDLSELAARIAHAIGRPLELRPYEMDA